MDARRQLPTGTVTLLFSDVESSTQIVHSLGAAWADVLERHREICRSAWAAHEGFVLGTEGDSFFVAFATAESAVAAALMAQKGIVEEAWPDQVSVRVRMGIHTGSPQRHADGYVGMDVHRAARIASAAHGGQVLLSEAAAGLVEPGLSDGVRLVDLGKHQLKDVPSRMRLLQLCAPGLPADFAPIRSLGAAGSLPVSLVELVGREVELSDLREAVTAGARLVTLTGPGGTGKTRLATALAAKVADLYPDGVFFVPMAGVVSAPGMWAVMSQVLDVPADGQVPPGFFTYVGRLQVLLVLDNLEQIEDADAVVRELVESAPHLTLVATSRRPLHITGEREYAVAPLPALAAQDLFIEHAMRVRRGFAITDENAADIAAICAALDGLPLAIELVAARSKLLSPKAILNRIDTALDLASVDRSRDARHETIRGAIAWSHDLLDSAHDVVFEYLGVFVGGASFAAVEAVVPAEDLDGQELAGVLFDLVDVSLVGSTDTDDGEPRFTMLETVRRFALDRLAADGGLEMAFAGHAQHYYDRARVWSDAVYKGHAAARREFVQELGNLGAVLSRGAGGISHRSTYTGVVPPAHVAALLTWLALDYARRPEAESWCNLTLRTLLGSDDQGHGRRALGWCQGWLMYERGDTRGSLEQQERVWAEVQSHLNEGAGLPSWVDPVQTARRTASTAGWACADLTDFSTATRWLDRLRSLDDDSVWVRAAAAELAYRIAEASNDLEQAWRHLTEHGRLLRDIGQRHRLLENNLADLELQMGRSRASQRRLATHCEMIIAEGDPRAILITSETMAAAIGADHPLLCARVYACSGRTRVVEGIFNDEYGVAEDERVLSLVRPLVGTDEWAAARRQGERENIVDLFREMAALPIPVEEE